ncbi:hypothetical protein ACFZCG_39210 [Streptomyces tanashiensis]|uniref:hypothetical protein n=1 Tax=Streptomyces tanashiensis TaxID=67367 RepID=UPI0036E1BDE7
MVVGSRRRGDVGTDDQTGRAKERASSGQGSGRDDIISAVAEASATSRTASRELGTGWAPAEGRDDALARSAFSRIETITWDQTFTRTLDELVGLQYSFSYSSPAVLGTRQAAFDELLRRELTEFSPNGIFENTVPIQAVIATRP